MTIKTARVIHGLCIVAAITAAHFWPEWRGALEGFAGVHVYYLAFKLEE